MNPARVGLMAVGMFVAALSQASAFQEPPKLRLFAPLSADLVPIGKLPLSPLPVGVTRKDTLIPGFIPKADVGVTDERRRLVLVCGLDGKRESIDAALRWANRFLLQTDAEWNRRWSLTLVPLADPDGTAGLTTAFPPANDAYLSRNAVEAQYLWRWLAMSGADAVVELRVADSAGWFGPGTPGTLEKGELAAALSAGPVATVGAIPAWRLNVIHRPLPDISQFITELERLVPKGHSPARKELMQRAARTPLEVAGQLAAVYGHRLDPVEYLQGTAVVGRLRLSELTNDAAMRADVERIAGAWLTKPTMNERSNGSNFAGHWIFAELARRTPQSGYVELIRQVGDRGFEADGSMRQAMPSHSEMSDAVFMGTPWLVEAGVLTGEAKYFEMADRHLQFMLKLNLRKDGLHRHSPLDDAAWGRGNGFPALGLALCLDRIPADRPERARMLSALQAHLAALQPHQDVTGMWHQVIDHPESYRELTSTCMITYAMLRGVQQGWLQADDYAPSIERAWEALKLRIGSDGTLFDVCTGTGKQRSLRDYYDRQAILGKDNRGGAMSLLVATEYARWKHPQR